MINSSRLHAGRKAGVRVYLLEDLNPHNEYSFEPDALIISLKPQVAWYLEKKAISYKLLEDFYQQTSLRTDEDVFFFDQLNWLNRFGEFLKQHIQECKHWDIDLARIHYNRLKYFIDPIIIRARILRIFLTQVNATSVVYFRQEPGGEEQPSIYNFKRKDRVSYLEILHLLQKQFFPSLTIREERVINSKHEKRSSRSLVDLKTLSVFSQLYRILKNCFHFFKYKKIKTLISNSKNFSNVNMLFLDAGTPAIDRIIAALVAEGAHVFLKIQQIILRIDTFWERKVKDWHLEKTELKNPISTDQYENAYRQLEQSKLINWINEKSALDVSSVVLPYFRNFITEICPQVIGSIQQFRNFYLERKINYVVARGSAGESYPAPLLAAKIDGVKRVCFQHGVDFTDRKDWVMDELDFFDVNFAMEGTSANYFLEQARLLPENSCQVLESSHYLQEISKRYRNNNLKKRGKKGKQTIFYVPIKLAHGLLKFNSFTYPMTWYYEHQKTLLQLFGKKTDFTFIYKHSPHQVWAEESVFPWLRSQNFNNIVIKTEVFSKYLREADGVILDGPTTSLFEATAAGLPVINFYHEAIKPWPPMFQVFGKCLQKFSYSDEVVQKIEAFLNSPNEYTANLQASSVDGIEYLKEISKNKPLSTVNYAPV